MYDLSPNRHSNGAPNGRVVGFPRRFAPRPPLNAVVGVFHVRLRERDGVPYLVPSPAPPPELLYASVTAPMDAAMVAALLRDPAPLDAVSPFALVLAGNDLGQA